MAWTTADRIVLDQPLGNGGRADAVGFGGVWSSGEVRQDEVGEDVLSCCRCRGSGVQTPTQRSLDPFSGPPSQPAAVERGAPISVARVRSPVLRTRSRSR